METERAMMPTPGAMRTAKALIEKVNPASPHAELLAARIVDLETGLPEKDQLLTELAGHSGAFYHCPDSLAQLADQARELLAKHGGTE